MQALLHGVRQIVARISRIDLGLRAHRCAMLDQQFHRLRMRLVGGPHQSRGSAQLVLGIHVGMLIQQHSDGVQIARARHQHQRRLAFRPELIRVGAGLQQLLDHRRASVQRRQIQRRGALAIGQLDVRAGRDQHVGHFQIVAISRPLDRRRAIRLRGVHIGFLLHQRLHRRPIAVHGRIGYRTVARRESAETKS